MQRFSHPALADSRVQQAGRVVACALLTALGARAAMHLPFTPVPVTWQVAAVLFSGLALGSRGALAAQSLYLLSGLMGGPVFAFGHGGAAYLFNTYGTGGYLLSYPLAAWLVGGVMEQGRSQDDRMTPFLACALGLSVIYGIGCVWLAFWLHLSPAQALLQGAGWFLAWDAAKALFAIGAAGGLRRGRPAH